MTEVAAIASRAMRSRRSASFGWIGVVSSRSARSRCWPAGDVARLQRGGAAALHQQPRLHARLAADQAGQVGAGLVVADHRDERHRRAQRGQVAHHVAGAAGHRDLARRPSGSGTGASGLIRVTSP